MKRKILISFLALIIILLVFFSTNTKVYASTSCNADEAIAKIQPLIKTTVRKWSMCWICM